MHKYHHTTSLDLIFICILSVTGILIYFYIFKDQFDTATAHGQLIIAPIMALGSFIAGSTCLGGGAVAFPALTKIIGINPFTAKSFSLAIQSVGMTSASIFILLRVRQLPWRFISIFTSASVTGIVISLLFLDQLLPNSDIRIGFTLFMLCFLGVFLHTSRYNFPACNQFKIDTTAKMFLIMGAGLSGGIISGLLGSGADLAAFCVLALYFRCKIKLAIQCSVMIMAVTSIIGVAIQNYHLQNLPESVFTLWLIAAPIVILGAPLGALFCKNTPTKFLFFLIITFIAIEILTTVMYVPIEPNKLKYYLASGTAVLILLVLLNKTQSTLIPIETKRYPKKKTRIMT